MSIKEQVINEAIERINKRLKAINEIFECRPLNRVIELQKQAQKLLDENTTIQQRTSHDFIFKIERLANEERRQLALACKKWDYGALTSEQVKLELELNDLKGELYCMGINKSKHTKP